MSGITAGARTGPVPTARRVAVVGSGLAGLAAAYLLQREGADVWLIEKAPRLGFHAYSVELDARRSDADCGDTLSAAPSPAKPRAPSMSPAKSKRVATGSAETIAVDVPMRSFQGGYYPLLIALYRHLGLSLQPESYAFSFSSLVPHPIRSAVARTSRETYFIHAGASGASLPNVPAAAWSNPSAFARAVLRFASVAVSYFVLLVVSFFNWHSVLGLLHGKGSHATFRDVVDSVAGTLEQPVRWLPRTGLGDSFRWFAADIVLPLFSAVGTMTDADVWSTPAVHLLDYIHAGVGTSHYTLGAGRSARDVAQLLAEPVKKQGADHIRLGTAIRAIRYRKSNGGRVLVLSLDGGDELEVDHVVIATPASVARSLLGTLEPSLKVQGEKAEARRVARMRSALEDVSYRETIVITHTDRASVLPEASNVRDINLFQAVVDGGVAGGDGDGDSADSTPLLTPTSSNSASPPNSPCPTPSKLPSQLGATPFFEPAPDAVYTMATHLVHAPQSAGYPLVLQTTNPVVPIDPEQVLGIARLERALPLRSKETLVGFHPPRGADPAPLIYLAGSYAYPGIPLLEGCVGTATRNCANE
ncbi:hypothetical protein Q8F55_003854 [Vanrija albida]|uniref:Amine oxidase domain-containing protein n=1 Tax=Vanrija albida TaxID=181172 RepID=A0ABR3Q547_9TREE